ncbi:MAG: hypothetical protein EOO05_08960 [Chitinophagaceae bacterium]|nr:MAG: hypothetical protein EOO05_08960 [Chitinophagaceae bacterium]
MKRFLTIVCFLSCGFLQAQDAVKGQAPGRWKTGYLDIHHINTGRGNAAFCVLPDGTTMLVDAGELSPLDARTFTERNAPQRPDTTKKPYEWLVSYITQVIEKPVIDYALLTHFHDDHFGAWYPSAPVSADGSFLRTGISGVGDLLKINTLVDRAYPMYNYPYNMREQSAVYGGGEIEFGKTMANYFRFIRSKSDAGMKQQAFRTGTDRQFILLHDAVTYPSFHIRNVKCNQWIWTGKDSSVVKHFPDRQPGDNKWPDENSLSLAITISYGNFIYYTGGDNPGEVFPGDDPLRDVETAIAQAVGPVDVAVMDHHGNRDAINAFQVKTMHPQVWVGQTWSSDHPGYEVLRRLRNKAIYPLPGDLFSTNMLEANRLVIGPMVDDAYKSQQGHILVRVMPGGNSFYVIVLDDDQPVITVKDVFGPYMSQARPAAAQTIKINQKK